MSHRQCVNPHDRIYGVLGLASDGAAIRPDYIIPVEETSKDLYRYIRANYHDRWGSSSVSVKEICKDAVRMIWSPRETSIK